MESMGTNESKFAELFARIPDKRQEWKVKHKLVDIIFIAVVAVIANCNCWETIGMFAEEREEWFRKYIELPNGIPSHDTIERVFSWIDPEIFRAVFMAWVKSAMCKEVLHGVVAIDGKAMRGSKDVGLGPLYVVNAWSSESKMFIGQVFVGEKTNEMKVIPKLVGLLDVKGQIVTIDAGGTYTDIADKIIEGKGDYVLALKGNQGNLHSDVSFFFENEVASGNASDYGIASIVKRDIGHGRIEKRTYYMTDNIDWLDGRDRWSGLKSIGMVKSHITNKATGAVTEDVRYFISSLTCDIERFAYAVRQHWGVESAHWSLDMTFCEDKRRSRKDNSAKNLAQLNRLVYDIFKKVDDSKKRSTIRRRERAMMNEEYLDEIIQAAF
jgi:predicted transposase YbfD/YdcC